MKSTTFFIVTLMAGLSATQLGLAQFAAPPPAPVVPLRSGAELDQMLGPIALYPDPLIAQILPAATMPAQVVVADRSLRGGMDPNLIDQQPWDASIKALARYPDVLKMMDDNLNWTTDLGQAFAAQPADVMESIQRLRAQAQALGNLQSTPQQQVLVAPGDIEIVPANPQFIYVPVYQPEVVFVRRPPPIGFWVSFGVGFRIGAWLNHDCDWHSHEVIVWHRDHPRPSDWWYRPARERFGPTVINRNVTVVNRNVTVWHPRSRPVLSSAQRADRGFDARDNRPRAAEPIRPVVRRAVPSPKPAPVVRDNRPVSRPQRVEAQPPPRAVTPSRPVTRAAAPRAAAPATARPYGSALVGVQSTRDTHQFSARGQESRQVVAKPAPAPRPAAPAPRPAGPGKSKDR
jgi:hypothetical protein